MSTTDFIVRINGKDVKDKAAARMASIAPVEASTTAEYAHDAGSCFWMNEMLYRATSAIAVGDTITVGTNCAVAAVVVISDVQVNGTSIVTNGVANVPIASDNTFGAVKTKPGNGITINASNELTINPASIYIIKAATSTTYPVTVSHQHESTFYGLAKAAGDSTQSASSNAVGTYTDTAKAAIQNMLGVVGDGGYVEVVSGTTPSITGVANVRYECDEVSTISITPPATGTIDVIFASGSTAALLTLPNTVLMPAWFDASSLDTNTIYEIMITDATYGSVMTWETAAVI